MVDRKQAKAMTITELQSIIAADFRRDLSDPDCIASFHKAQIATDIRRAISKTPGLTQSKLAEVMGCSKQYIHEALNESVNFTIDTLAKFSAALGRTLVARLLAEDEAMPVIPANRLEAVRQAAFQGVEEVKSVTADFKHYRDLTLIYWPQQVIVRPIRGSHGIGTCLEDEEALTEVIHG